MEFDEDEEDMDEDEVFVNNETRKRRFLVATSTSPGFSFKGE